MITIKAETSNYGVCFPSSIKELNAEVFNSITKNVKLPKHYCIVALAFKVKLFDFCAMINSNRNSTIGVTPIIAKISEEDSKEINASVCDRIIIDRSSLERGVQLKLPILISSDNFRKYLNDNPTLSKAIISKDKNLIVTYNKVNYPLVDVVNSDIIVLEFKIVPVNDISASIPINVIDIDPFRTHDGEC